MKKSIEKKSMKKKSRLNLVLPLAITLVLMVLVVIYTSRLFYRISVSNIYEVGGDKISGLSASLGNYIDTTKSVVWVTADSVDFMIQSGESQEMVLDYLMEETVNHKMQFDENYTGLYGYIRGEYLDGLGWEPPEGYDPRERDWYRLAKLGGGDLVIVPPYIDAQTGSVVITVCKLLSDGESVLALDVITNHIQHVVDTTDINDKGYGFILDGQGIIIAHKDTSLNGKDLTTVDGGSELMEKLKSSDGSSFETTMNDRLCTVFAETIMDQWYILIVVENSALFGDVYSQLRVNVAVNMIVFLLIAMFYFLAYRSEKRSSREAEELRISEQQKIYEAELLRLEKAAADSANKAKGDFLAQMSHEIRTPINAVLGMNEMILRESEDENILEYSGNIQNAGKTLLSLINSILDFSKIEDGKMEIIPVEYDTISLINALINSVSERARSKGLEFVIKADPRLPRMMTGDDVRLGQVIMNLLTNAMKYTEKGRVTFSMSVAERDETQVTVLVSVEDTGIGIRKEDMGKLIESFSRLEEQRNRNIEGTSLGMAIVTKLLRLMNSALKIESVYGRGSVFSFEIKQGIADPEPIGENIERRSDPVVGKKRETRKFTGVDVLVTDDNDMNLKVARNLLKLFGIKADLASSGAETIEMMRQKHYDIVFLDHMMPRMDGIETLDKLRNTGLVKDDTVMIALTANAVIGAKKQYLAAGFSDYLSKPIELQRLEKMLAKYLPEKAEISEAEDDVPMEFAPVADDEVMEFAPCDEEASVEDSGDLLKRLEEAGISVGSAMKYFADDEGFYREMLEEYVSGCEKTMQDMRRALSENSTESYRITVHSLKSTSRTVGVDDVSELARELENAAKKGDSVYINAHCKELETLYGAKVSLISEILANDR